MPTYHLLLTFRGSDDGTTQAFDTKAIEAETDARAIAQAKAIMQDAYSELLNTATLRTATGSVVWSLRRPEPG